MSKIENNGPKQSIRLGDISPSQPDDGKYYGPDDPIEVYEVKGGYVVFDGNHRYYAELYEKGSDSYTVVEIVDTPL